MPHAELRDASVDVARIGYRALVTGGAGFIGRYVLNALEDFGFETYCVDRHQCPVKISGEAAKLDLLNFEDIRSFLSKVAPHYIFHLAGLGRVDGGKKELFAENVTATEHLMRAIPPSVKKVIYTSTQLVVRMGDDPRDGEYYNPYTLYGESKAEMERRIRAFSPNDWLIVRPTTIWGPFHPSFAAGLYKYIQKGVYLHPRAKVIRSYGYVENAADQIVKFGLNEQVKSRVLYISDAPIDSGEFLDMFSEALRGTKVHRVDPRFLSALGKIGDQLHRIGVSFPLESERVRRMTSDYLVPIDETLKLAGPPKISLDEGVLRTVRWLRGKVGSKPIM